MSDERKRILQMLSDGKISVDEAERLLTALGSSDRELDVSGEQGGVSTGRGAIPKYMYVSVQPKQEGKGERVNVRVPFGLFRAGMKFASLIPKNAQDKISSAMEDKGIDLDLSNIKSENINELLEALRDLQVDVDSEDEVVKVYCE
jgi:hypothetical protein